MTTDQTAKKCDRVYEQNDETVTLLKMKTSSNLCFMELQQRKASLEKGVLLHFFLSVNGLLAEQKNN